MAEKLNSFEYVDTIYFLLDKETTLRLLGACDKAFSTQLIEIFIVLILHEFSLIFLKRKVPTFSTESHGREAFSYDIDPSETIGWFTAMFPVELKSEWTDAIEVTRRVKDQRGGFPDRGWR